MNRREFVTYAGGAALTALGARSARADSAILTINDTRNGHVTQFTDAELLALPQVSFETTTIWTSGLVTFSGPTLKSVLRAADVDGGSLRMYAINDYDIDFPDNYIEETAPIIANRINGQPFSVREKGPLWVIFPFDQDARFQDEEVFSLCVWQLMKIDVRAS